MTQVSKSQCIQLQSNPGYYLIRDAAYAWDRAVAAFGKRVLITGAWRSYETQVELFDSELFPRTGRYVRGNRAGQPGYTTDVRGRTADGGLYRGSWWTRKAGTASAAVPGTSNHGGGVAVDVKTSRQAGDPPYSEAVIFGSWTDADRTRFLHIATEHGWDDDEGRSVGELWHLTYYPARDKHRGVKPTTNLQEEPDMDTTQATQLSETRALVGDLKELLKELHSGEYPKIDATAETGPTAPKVTNRTAIKQIRLAVMGGLDDAVARGVRAALASTPGVDATAITKGVVGEVRKTLAAIENTEYVLTPKES